jgi:hypothetical protein
VFAGTDCLLGARRGGMMSSSFPMSSLLYNSFVDNDVVDSDNGLKQQSMHGVIVLGSPSAVVKVVINLRRVWRAMTDSSVNNRSVRRVAACELRVAAGCA